MLQMDRKVSLVIPRRNGYTFKRCSLEQFQMLHALEKKGSPPVMVTKKKCSKNRKSTGVIFCLLNLRYFILLVQCLSLVSK